MISPSLRIDHFDPDEWRLLQKLLVPSSGGGGGLFDIFSGLAGN